MAVEMDPATRDSIRYVLDQFGVAEAKHVLLKLDAGEVFGVLYFDGECGCLIGTAVSFSETNKSKVINRSFDISSHATDMAESWFVSIIPGVTPKTNEHAKLAYQVIEEWVKEHTLNLEPVHMKKFNDHMTFCCPVEATIKPDI